MKRLGINGGWRALAQACLNNAIKTSDIDFAFEEETFPAICGLSGYDENEVIIALRFAEDMKRKYGNKWYKEFGYGKTTRNGFGLLTES